MPLFPLFIDLTDKKCVFIGGGNVATRKIHTLLGFNAEITVVSPKSTAGIKRLSAEKRLVWHRREYSAGDLEQAFMVCAATSDRRLNEKIHDEAVRRNIFVNVADCPEKCTFVFPSTVRRDELVVGISTSGNCPALAKKIREKVAKMLPDACGDGVKIVREYRKKAVQEIRDTEKRKEFLKTIVDELFYFCENDRVENLSNRIDELFEVYKNEKKD
jgi:siroheme synthase-like protein